jgi:hypothetical protein
MPGNLLRSFAVKSIVAAIFLALFGVSLIASGCATGLTSKKPATTADGYGWTRGNLILTTIHSISECHDATRSALASLGIDVVSDETDKLSGKIEGRGPEGESVTVNLIPQGLYVTRIEVRVGSPGSRADSELIADSIHRYLP